MKQNEEIAGFIYIYSTTVSSCNSNEDNAPPQKISISSSVITG